MANSIVWAMGLFRVARSVMTSRRVNLWALIIGPSAIIPMSVWAANVGRDVAIAQLIGAAILTFGIAALAVEFVGVGNPGQVIATQSAILLFWTWHVVPIWWFPSPPVDMIVGLLAVAAAGWLMSHLVSFDWLPQMLGVGIGVATAAMIVTGIAGDWVGTTLPDPAPPAEIAGATESEDLLILVLDAHASPAVLEKLFDYDMGGTLRGLEKAGFKVLDSALSNYSMTHFSVPSLLALDYMAEPGLEVSPAFSAFSAMSRRVVAGDAGLMAWMTAAGYAVTKFESGWEEDACGDVSRCFDAGWRGNVTSWLVVDRTPFRSVWPGHPYPSTALSVLETLPGVVAEAAANDRPDFIMAHVLSPHAPLFLTADCQNRFVYGLGGLNVGTPDMPTTVKRARAEAYANQASCVGKHLLAIAEAIKGTDMVVLVTGDHGSDFDGQTWFPLKDWTQAQIKERFSVFAAVRSPGSCGTVPDSLVNLGRYAAGCALGLKLPYLADRFLGSGGSDSPLEDVTERVARIRDEAGSTEVDILTWIVP